MPNQDFKPTNQGLIIVGLPIGNDGDISLRALQFLGQTPYLACEDRRVIKRFLTQHHLPCPELILYHDHNGAQARPLILEKLHQGHTVGLVSDRGMPLVSDPGYKLVSACIHDNIPVSVLPGPSSVLTALCLSGLSPDRFFFQGFLPRKENQQQTLLKTLLDLEATLIFFEAPHRLVKTLQVMAAVFADRQACVARELTKTYENVQRGNLHTLIRYYETTPPKGELVILIEGATPNSKECFSDQEIEQRLEQALKKHGFIKDAVADVAQQTGLARKALYQKSLKINNLL